MCSGKRSNRADRISCLTVRFGMAMAGSVAGAESMSISGRTSACTSGQPFKIDCDFVAAQSPDGATLAWSGDQPTTCVSLVCISHKGFNTEDAENAEKAIYLKFIWQETAAIDLSLQKDCAHSTQHRPARCFPVELLPATDTCNRSFLVSTLHSQRPLR